MRKFPRRFAALASAITIVGLGLTVAVPAANAVTIEKHKILEWSHCVETPKEAGEFEPSVGIPGTSLSLTIATMQMPIQRACDRRLTVEKITRNDDGSVRRVKVKTKWPGPIYVDTPNAVGTANQPDCTFNPQLEFIHVSGHCEITGYTFGPVNQSRFTPWQSTAYALIDGKVDIAGEIDGIPIDASIPFNWTYRIQRTFSVANGSLWVDTEVASCTWNHLNCVPTVGETLPDLRIKTASKDANGNWVASLYIQGLGQFPATLFGPNGKPAVAP